MCARVRTGMHVYGGGECLGCEELLKGTTVRLASLKNVHTHPKAHIRRAGTEREEIE